MSLHQPISAFDIAAVLVVLATVFAYLNHRLLRLPLTVGLTAVSALAAAAALAVNRLWPTLGLADELVRFVSGIDFHDTLMNGMLSFLLFAGALHVDWTAMKAGRWPILALSTLGVLVSTGLVGVGFAALSALFGAPVPLAWALVFGALISPTDPVSVMQALKRVSVPDTLQATVAGESLFNDGVGVVVFAILLETALQGGGAGGLNLAHAGGLFLQEAVGGVLLGLALGWIAFQAMRAVDESSLEILITLSVVMGGYAVARPLHVSGPVAMAVAGLIIGNHGVQRAMSETTRDYLLKFWSLIDELLNAVLFLLIGLLVLVVPHDLRLLSVGAASILLALLARAVSVGAPLLALRPLLSLGPLAPPILVWGGLRGGISVALALSLPDSPAASVVLAATYVVVMFSVIVQGGTIGALLARLTKA